MNVFARCLCRTAPLLSGRFNYGQQMLERRALPYMVSNSSSNKKKDPFFTRPSASLDQNPMLEGFFTKETAAEYLSNLNEEETKTLKILKLEHQVWSSTEKVSETGAALYVYCHFFRVVQGYVHATFLLLFICCHTIWSFYVPFLLLDQNAVCKANSNFLILVK